MSDEKSFNLWCDRIKLIYESVDSSRLLKHPDYVRTMLLPYKGHEREFFEVLVELYKISEREQKELLSETFVTHNAEEKVLNVTTEEKKTSQPPSSSLNGKGRTEVVAKKERLLKENQLQTRFDSLRVIRSGTLEKRAYVNNDEEDKPLWREREVTLTPHELHISSMPTLTDFDAHHQSFSLDVTSCQVLEESGCMFSLTYNDNEIHTFKARSGIDARNWVNEIDVAKQLIMKLKTSEEKVSERKEDPIIIAKRLQARMKSSEVQQVRTKDKKKEKVDSKTGRKLCSSEATKEMNHFEEPELYNVMKEQNYLQKYNESQSGHAAVEERFLSDREKRIEQIQENLLLSTPKYANGNIVTRKSCKRGRLAELRCTFRALRSQMLLEDEKRKEKLSNSTQRNSSFNARSENRKNLEAGWKDLYPELYNVLKEQNYLQKYNESQSERAAVEERCLSDREKRIKQIQENLLLSTPKYAKYGQLSAPQSPSSLPPTPPSNAFFSLTPTQTTGSKWTTPPSRFRASTHSSKGKRLVLSPRPRRRAPSRPMTDKVKTTRDVTRPKRPSRKSPGVPHLI
eukprot:g2409.t1